MVQSRIESSLSSRRTGLPFSEVLSRQAPQLGKQSLESLPEGVWLNSIGRLKSVSVRVLQFVLNEQIQLGSGEVSSEYAAVEKMAELGTAVVTTDAIA